MEHRDRQDENLKRPSVNLQRLEEYFEYLYSSGERVVEQGCRRFADGTTLPERRRDYSERSDYSNIGKEMLHGFIDRVRKELREAMEKGETSVSIRVSLPNISNVYPCGIILFMDDISDYLEPEEGVKVSYNKIGAENSDGSRDLIITFEREEIDDLSASQDASENLKDITATEQYFEYLEKDDGRRKRVSIIRSKIGLALMFTGALTVGIGGAAYYHQGSKKSNTEAMVELEPTLTTTAEQTAEPESIIPQFKTIYCEISREQKGYTPACRASGKPKIIVLEDIDKTDNLVPVEIKVPMDGIDFACKAVIEKTPPNEDGSSKIIMQGDLECTSSD